VIGIYVAAILVCLASLLVGRALFALIGRDEWTWLEGAVGLAALIVVAHVAISLPGGAIVAVIILVLLLLAAARVVWRGRPSRRRRLPTARSEGEPVRGWTAPPPAAVAVAVVTIVLLAAAIPFALNARTGVLGEGIYSNDHAVHLYWADWLQNEIGPKPKGIGWGYPVGPHALVAAIAEATGITVEAAFNGLMLAISALTALTSLAALRRLRALPRVVAAILVGLPFLAVSFLAQSSFKEMAIALFVLALALSLAALSREGPDAADAAGSHPDRALVVGIALLAVASVLTFSVPGLAWFALGIPVWLAVELIAGRLPFSPRAALDGLRRAWPVLAAAAVVLAVLAIVEAGTISRFADRIGGVQESQGRLAGRLPPWEVLGVWPRGDFRVATNAVDGAEIAILFGLLAAVVATVWWLRRRELAVPAVLAAAVAIFLVARFTSGIHVEAKALIVASPLVMLFILRGLLDDDRRSGDGRARAGTTLRIALGALFAGAAVLSSFLALRATPVGTSAHPDELAELRSRVAGKEVAFLSLDRFAPYRLRGAERVQSPGGYVPNALRAREGKKWEQGEAIDFDTLETDVLDRFGYAVTTAAIYGSSAPENWSVVERTPSFVLWKRNGKDGVREVLAEDTAPGKTADPGSPACPPVTPGGTAGEPGSAGFWSDQPVLADSDPWRPDPEFAAGKGARLELLLPEGTWQLALQYNSEVPLTLRATGGLERTLPAVLDGMYANAPGKGPFWPAGEVDSEGGTVEVEVSADEAPRLSRLVGAERHAWLGDLAAVRVPSETRDPSGPPSAESGPLATAPLSAGCGRYVDWYILER
jgi:hypothetical protein